MTEVSQSDCSIDSVSKPGLDTYLCGSDTVRTASRPHTCMVHVLRLGISCLAAKSIIIVHHCLDV